MPTIGRRLFISRTITRGDDLVGADPAVLGPADLAACCPPLSAEPLSAGRWRDVVLLERRSPVTGN